MRRSTLKTDDSIVNDLLSLAVAAIALHESLMRNDEKILMFAADSQIL